MPEAVWFKLRGHGWSVQHGIVALLGFGWWDVPDGLEQAAVVEPVNPFQCGKFDGFEVAPGSTPMDHFGLVKPVDCFCQSIVIGITDTAD